MSDKVHGMMFSPEGGTGGGGSGSGGPKKPSGMGFPAVKSEHLAGKMGENTGKFEIPEEGPPGGGQPPRPPSGPTLQSPMPVALVPGTFWKMLGIFLIPTFGLISAGFCVYWKMGAHMYNKQIHPTIADFDIKVDAKVSQTVGLVRDEVRIQISEIKLSQKKEINRLGDELKEDLKVQQKQGMDKILDEVKKTRKAVRGTHPD
jgi:hypothetical protein